MTKLLQDLKRVTENTVTTPELAGELFATWLRFDSSIEVTDAQREMLEHIDAADLEPVFNITESTIELTTLHAGRTATVARYYFNTDTFEVL